MSSASPRRAFTLIELLTVIAIIGILAAILIPTIGKVRESARGAHCISNLRQIGSAIQLYTDGNRGVYPGPLYTIQGPYYTDALRSFARFLEPYLPVAQVTGSQKKSLVFLCPSWELATAGLTNAQYPYVANLDPKYADGAKWNIQPFGDANSTKLPQQATKLASFPLSQTWLLSELDKERSNRTEPMPEKAVHGSYRNELFYDYHVARTAK